MINPEILLKWYDANARAMPWRIPPTESAKGIRPDPYHIWLSEIMLQQTTVAAVVRYFLAFQRRWPTVHALANADDADVMGEWAGLGYYARARNLLKTARVISADLGGSFPETEAELIRLPGIGPYTSAAIAAIAFDQPATVVDANVERVIARAFAVSEPLPDSKPALKTLASNLTPSSRPGDFAQAMMDLGATVCGQLPQCEKCPISEQCLGRQRRIAATLPKKRPKPIKPVRYGVAYFARRDDGAVLLETRPQSGLLGGMLALPTTEWSETAVDEAPPVKADWATLPEPVKHTFTHFHLLLTLRVANPPTGHPPDRGGFMNVDETTPGTLPTVMRKAFVAASTALDANGA